MGNRPHPRIHPSSNGLAQDGRRGPTRRLSILEDEHEQLKKQASGVMSPGGSGTAP